MIAALFVFMTVLGIAPQKAMAETSSRGTVVIDPGHNVTTAKGFDTGCVAPDTSVANAPLTTEAGLVMSLSAKLADILKIRGYTVYSTLYINDSIPNLLPKSSTNPYSLSQRVTASATVQPDLFMAVHVNSSSNVWDTVAFNGRTTRGFMVLYDSGQAGGSTGYPGLNSLALANCLWDSVHAWGGAEGRADPVHNQAATVLRSNLAPAVTLEAGFINNKRILQI